MRDTMFGKNDAEKYQTLFGILSLISIPLALVSESFLPLFWILLLAAIFMIIVEQYGKKTDSTPLKFNMVGVFGIFFITLLVASALSGGVDNSEPSMTYYDDGAKEYNEGVDNYNKGISFYNDGMTNLRADNMPAAIAAYEISRDFFSSSKTNFDASLSESDANSNLYTKANYMAESSDYFVKGIDEYTAALRLIERYNDDASTVAVGIGIILDPTSGALGISSDFTEIKIKSEKARKYFDLATGAMDAADQISS